MCQCHIDGFTLAKAMLEVTEGLDAALSLKVGMMMRDSIFHQSLVVCSKLGEVAGEKVVWTSALKPLMTKRITIEDELCKTCH